MRLDHLLEAKTTRSAARRSTNRNSHVEPDGVPPCATIKQPHLRQTRPSFLRSRSTIGAAGRYRFRPVHSGPAPLQASRPGRRCCLEDACHPGRGACGARSPLVRWKYPAADVDLAQQTRSVGSLRGVARTTLAGRSSTNRFVGEPEGAGSRNGRAPEGRPVEQDRGAAATGRVTMIGRVLPSAGAGWDRRCASGPFRQVQRRLGLGDQVKRLHDAVITKVDACRPSPRARVRLHRSVRPVPIAVPSICSGDMSSAVPITMLNEAAASTPIRAIPSP